MGGVKVDDKNNVTIDLEGKAYGDGYDSSLMYRPNRSKGGHEIYDGWGTPVRAERVYEILRNLKGIKDVQNITIRESYD